MKKLLKTLSDEITVLEASRDFEGFSVEEKELYDVINLCYDLLCRTKAALNEDGEQQYIPVSNQLADFAFAIATKQGEVNLRTLLDSLRGQITQEELANSIGVRRATLSDYRNGKTPFSADGYEKCLNYIIKKHAL